MNQNYQKLQVEKFSDFLQEKLKNPSFAKAHKEAVENLNLALRIRELRKQRALTQKQLALQVGTGQARIARIEQGLCVPKLDLLSRIAVALGAHLKVEMVQNAPTGEKPSAPSHKKALSSANKQSSSRKTAATVAYAHAHR